MPGEWPKTHLGRIADVIVGGTPSTAVARFWGGDIPWMASGDVHAKRIFDVPGRITSSGYASSNAKLVSPPTVAIALAGQGKTRGTAALVSVELATNQSIALIKSIDSCADANYLFHNLDYRYDELRSSSAGGGRAGLSKGILEYLSIALPPLPEQRRIAEILDTIDRTIEGTQRVIEKLQATRQGLLQDLLTRGLDEHGQLRNPQRHPEQFKDTELGRVPVEWEIRRLEDFCSSIADGTHNSPQPQEIGYPLITSKNLRNGKLDLDDAYRISKNDYTSIIQRSRVERFDILFAMIGTIGNPVIIDSDEGIATKNVGILRFSRDRDKSLWAYNSINAPFVLKQIEDLVAGSTQRFIGLGSLRSLLIPVPVRPREILGINQLLLSFNNQARAEKAQLAKLQTLKRGLMDDLLTGRVRVPGAQDQVRERGHIADISEAPSADLTTVPMPPPAPPRAPQVNVMYRAAERATAQAKTDWAEQLAATAQHQQVGLYSPEALDAVLTELLALTREPEGVHGVPEVLARAGIRFVLRIHPKGSGMSGAAFYLDEPGRSQPVVGLSLLNPYLDVFWFNLLHELAHIRLNHAPVSDESLEAGAGDPDDPAEQQADTWARNLLIPKFMWDAFAASGEFSSNRIRRFAGRLGRHSALVAGRLGYETGEWIRFNDPRLRPSIKTELSLLAQRLSPGE